MKLKLQGVALLAFGVFMLGNTAKAELPADFNMLMPIIEQYVLGNSGKVPSSVTVGGCTAAVANNYTSATLTFVASPTCKLNGKIMFSAMPLGASVRMEIMDSPITAIDGDYSMWLQNQGGFFSKNKVTTFNWQLVNARVAFRLQPGMPLQEFMISGEGKRVNTKVNNASSIDGSSRVNVFDRATTNGMARLGELHQISGGATVRNNQICNLYGADASKVQSGQLVGCHASPF